MAASQSWPGSGTRFASEEFWVIQRWAPHTRHPLARFGSQPRWGQQGDPSTEGRIAREPPLEAGGPCGDSTASEGVGQEGLPRGRKGRWRWGRPRVICGPDGLNPLQWVWARQ